jgi:GTP-binding protein EngB required for normal cell division
LTKCDKLGTQAQRRTLDAVSKDLAEAYALHRTRIGVQLFSATRHIGIAEAEAALARWLLQAN